ncbi:TonB-dependent receptor [Asticcacaulis sp. BYS171W]|uniref:TonB-dependent receptor n=1 Tax=Asticcacaulis aquaticus TaxID=2984212 RepID=A0ABT5HXJ0_9CAUL|nr:TonB-dependent receptor [Asticcacaulis aquaticus]MDC7684778.1 TonB-dependent receptor [Asticcacaulis aquaticus]
MNKSWILAGTALTTLFAAHGAMAQSTGTQTVEEVQDVVVKGQRNRNIGGLAVDQTVTKTRSSITEEFIEKQGPGSILEAINLLPGVNFSDQTASGSVGGDITLRGFDQQRIAFLLDGMPLNDTGNYAYYPTMNPDSEIYSKVDVNLGTTDVDSPTASAGGGTINYQTRRPDKEFGVFVKGTFGTNEYAREYVRVDTGEIGPWGTTAFVAASNLNANKFKGVGTEDRMQVNGRIYQPLGDGDFASVAFYYNETRNNNMYNISRSRLMSGFWSDDYAATIDPVLANATSSGITGFYGYRINPTDNGNIRGQFKKHLTENLVLTVDPSFQYTLADGGTQVTTINETTGVLSASSSFAWGELVGYDANKDGKLSTYNVFSPSVTKTRRVTVNSSLIWYINPQNTLRFAYTYDRGNHRQTGRYSLLEGGNWIGDPFSEESSLWLKGKNGEEIQKRNRQSYANLNQFAITYGGSYFESKLKFDLGVRVPKFERELNNYCYQTSSSVAYCANVVPVTPITTGTPTTIQAKKPTSWTVSYDKVLPNAGISYKLSDHQTVYASYAETISAPRTDSLYDRLDITIEPETSSTTDIGYRYSSPLVSGSIALWKTDFEHRVETAWDESIGASVATDVGAAKMEGINAELGFRPVEGLDIYTSASYTDTEMLNDVKFGASATQVNLVKGKKLGKIPSLMYAVNVNYETGAWDFSVTGKYTGKRYASLQNIENAPGYTVWNANVRYSVGDFGPMKNTYVQMNVKNLFNEKYMSAISTGNVFSDTASTSFYWVGAPITTLFTIGTKF